RPTAVALILRSRSFSCVSLPWFGGPLSLSLSLSRSCTFPSRFDSIADSIEASRPRFPRLPPSPHLQGMSRTRKRGLAAQRSIFCALDRIEILS
ncbi:hypothetical protein BHE74_00056695, partial [Ensete ventricosum]